MTSQEIAAWYEEQEQIFNKNQEDERMALTEFEEKIRSRERDRSDLLQRLSHLEGTLDGNSKITQDQFFILLNVVREIIENGK